MQVIGKKQVFFSYYFRYEFIGKLTLANMFSQHLTLLSLYRYLYMFNLPKIALVPIIPIIDR